MFNKQMSWPQTETVSTKLSCMTNFFKQKENLNQTPKHQEPLFTLDFKWKPETACLWQALFFQNSEAGSIFPSVFLKGFNLSCEKIFPVHSTSCSFSGYVMNFFFFLSYKLLISSICYAQWKDYFINIHNVW